MEALLKSQISLVETGERYELEGNLYDRTTDILAKVLPPYLVPFGENTGIQGAHKVAEANDGQLPASWEQTREVMKNMGVDTESIKTQGGNRGAQMHFALEAWIKQGIPPEISDFEPEHRPYAISLAEFLVDYEPIFECSELTVWHPELMYAGTIDAIGTITKQPSNAKHGSLISRRFAFDVKTNKAKRIYFPQHYFQLAAYRYALDYHKVGVEGEAVIALGPSPWKSGRKPYTVGVNYVPARLWPPIVEAYRALEEAKALNPRGRKK